MDEQSVPVPPDNTTPSLSDKNNQPQAKRLFLYIGAAVFILVLFATVAMASRMQKSSKIILTPSPTPVITFIVPKPTVTDMPTVIEISPTSSIVPSNSNPTPTKKAALFQLGFSTINYSTAWPTGEVLGVIARLYDSQGKLLGEKPVPPTVYKGNTGTGGNVIFGVPLGTYKVVIENDMLTGSQEVTIKSFNDQQYYSVYMYAKPITISGYYFIDQNKNNQFDNGERTLSHKRINVTVKTERGNLYESGITTTNNEGFYTVTGKYVGSYTLYGEYEQGYVEQPAHWVNAIGGQSITLHYYLWPDF